MGMLKEEGRNGKKRLLRNPHEHGGTCKIYKKINKLRTELETLEL